MTKAEIARMRRLELENAELRRQVDKHIEVYREQAVRYQRPGADSALPTLRSSSATLPPHHQASAALPPAIIAVTPLDLSTDSGHCRIIATASAADAPAHIVATRLTPNRYRHPRLSYEASL